MNDAGRGGISPQKGKTMDDARITFNIPNEEYITDRLEELREYLRNFPDGIMAQAVRNEISRLEAML